MWTCISNILEVMKYEKPSSVASYAELSQRTAAKVIAVLRTNPIETDKATKKLIDFADKEGIIVFNKNSRLIYDKKSTTKPLSVFDQCYPDEFAAWIQAEGVIKGDCIVIKQFNALYGVKLDNNQSQVHFEKGEWVCFDEYWQTNVTIGQLKRLWLHFNPKSDLPIQDSSSVEEVRFYPTTNFELTFLKHFPNLKRLEVHGQSGLLLSKPPALPNLIEFLMDSAKIIITTEKLRELEIKKVSIDDELVKYISSQTRLIKLIADCIENALFISFPSTLKKLDWFPNFKSEDNQLYLDHLIMQLSSLKLRSFETNVQFDNIDWLNTDKLKNWGFNGVSRKKVNGKIWLTIISYKTNLSYLDLKAEECEIKTSDLSVLHLINGTTETIRLFKELKEEIDKLPVLVAVTDLTIRYKVTDSQAKLLARIFPQFTVAQLKEKVIDYYRY